MTEPTSTTDVAQPTSDVTNARQTAVQYAMAQIGKPYVFDAAGPNAYDCSGLTQMAWAAAGIKVTHNAAAQFGETTHIPIDSAQPGDIGFVGEYEPSQGEPHHVFIIVGGGQLCEAYDTGYPIRLAAISEYTGRGLNAMAGQMPVPGGYAGITNVADTSAATPASTTSTSSGFLGLGSTGKLLKSVTAASFWKRVGLGALGVIILILTVRWMIHNGIG